MSSGMCNALGTCKLKINKCDNHGEIKTNGRFAAGIANILYAQAEFNVQECNNYGLVQTNGGFCSAAGIVTATGDQLYQGMGERGSVIKCINEGTIETTNIDKMERYDYEDTVTAGVFIVTTLDLDIQDCENKGNIQATTANIAGIGFGYAVENKISNCKNTANITIEDDAAMATGGIISMFVAESNHNDSMICDGLENNGDIIVVAKEKPSKVGYVSGCLISLNEQMYLTTSELQMNNCINTGEIDISNADPREVQEVAGIVSSNGQPIVILNGCKNEGKISTPISDKLYRTLVAGIATGYFGKLEATDCINSGDVVSVKLDEVEVNGLFAGSVAEKIETRCSNVGEILLTELE